MDDYTIVGDPHVKPNNLELFHELCAKVEKLGKPTIWLGDLLDTKEVIRGKCLNAWFDYFKASPLRHTILVGNHDWFNLQCQEHSLEVLKILPNVNVVDKPQWTTGQMGFLPYIHDEKELKKWLKKMSDDHVKIVFGHLELKGFDFGNGYICKEGLTEKSFRKFTKIISGHFHKFQEKGNVTYLGTPFSHSFGESNQTKYIGSLENGELKKTPTNLPQHVTYDIDADEGEAEEYRRVFLKKNIYRVILTGRQEAIDAFDRDKYSEFNIKWITRPTEEKINVEISDTQSNEVQFSKWGSDVAELDQETLQLGLQILGACND